MSIPDSVGSLNSFRRETRAINSHQPSAIRSLENSFQKEPSVDEKPRIKERLVEKVYRSTMFIKTDDEYVHSRLRTPTHNSTTAHCQLNITKIRTQRISTHTLESPKPTAGLSKLLDKYVYCAHSFTKEFKY